MDRHYNTKVKLGLTLIQSGWAESISNPSLNDYIQPVLTFFSLVKVIYAPMTLNKMTNDKTNDLRFLNNESEH